MLKQRIKKNKEIKMGRKNNYMDISTPPKNGKISHEMMDMAKKG